jgi:hypothetical protein
MILKRIFIFSLVCMVLQACNPIPKLLRPKLDITVLDQQNQKMDDVNVVLDISHLDGKWMHYQILKKTENGKIVFHKVKRINILNTNKQTYFWSMCIFKEGYERLTFNPPKDLKKKQQLIFTLKPVLEQTDSKQCIYKKNQ